MNLFAALSHRLGHVVYNLGEYRRRCFGKITAPCPPNRLHLHYTTSHICHHNGYIPSKVQRITENSSSQYCPIASQAISWYDNTLLRAIGHQCTSDITAHNTSQSIHSVASLDAGLARDVVTKQINADSYATARQAQSRIALSSTRTTKKAVRNGGHLPTMH